MFGFRTRITVIVALAALAITACGATGSSSGPVIADGAPGSTVSTTASSNSTTANPGLTAEEVQAMIDKSIAEHDKAMKDWVNGQGFAKTDDLQKLVDEEFAALIDTAGYLTQDDIDAIVAQLKEAGMSDADVASVTETLIPTDGPQQGIAGENPCTNRAVTDETQLLLDLGRELKLADTASPDFVPSWRQSFANWDESDLGSVSTLWNEVVGNVDHEITLDKPARARVYWCAGTDADGTVRSGVWRHQLMVPAGKMLYNFGNGVTAQKDCHNLTIFIRPPNTPPPGPGPTPTTAPTTTLPGPTTTPPTTQPTTTVPGPTTTTTVPTSTSVPKPPVSTIAPPPTTAAPAVSVPPATSPVTLATNPPEVTNPLPAVTSTTGVKPPEAPPCNPLAAPGAPDACPGA